MNQPTRKALQPRHVSAFACAFKCGQRVTVKRASMVAHQERCILNPETRSCPTCEHNGHEPHEEPDYASGYPGNDGGYFCAEDHLSEGVVLRQQCPFWAARKEAQ